MNTMIDTTKVTAVQLMDGWREGVTDFIFFGDDQHVDSIARAGASWSERGCRFTCPLSAVRAVREGTPPPEEPKPGRPNDRLQSAVRWLETALQDGLPHSIKAMRENAKGEAAVSAEMLDRAWKHIGAKARKVNGVWCWQMVAAESVGENPERVELIT
jgi:hypothetical protein